MNQLSIYPFVLALTTFGFFSCGKKATIKEPVVATRPIPLIEQTDSSKPNPEVPDTMPGQRHVVASSQCFGSSQAEGLELLPRSISEAKRDTSLLRRLNERDIFIIEPGEKGFIIAEQPNKVQVRFPDKIVWVMKSNVI